MFDNNPKNNLKKARRDNNSSNPMLNIPRYDSFGNPVPNRLMAADLGSTFNPMFTLNLYEQTPQEFGGDEDIRALAEMFGLANSQPQQVVVNSFNQNGVRPDGLGNVPPPPMFMAIPNMANLNMGVNNPAHEAVNPQPRQVVRVQQVRPEIPTQQAKPAELSKRIRQGQHVPKVPQFSRVHMAQSAHRVGFLQDFTSIQQQQQMMHEQLMQQARLMQQAGQLQQPVPREDLTEEQKQQQIDKLKAQWKDNAMNRDIDDKIVFSLWDRYGHIQSLAPTTIDQVGWAAKRFCSYLKNTANSGGIKSPKKQDVLDFIGSLRLSKDNTTRIEFRTAIDTLSLLKTFFKFLKKLEIYNNITEGLGIRNIRRMYGYQVAKDIDDQQQQAVPQIDQSQNVAELKKVWTDHAIDCDIDDEIVFYLLKKYGNLRLSSEGTINSIKSVAKRFCSYLRKTPNSGGIENPTSQDVLNFIRSLMLGEDETNPITFVSARNILYALKPFFKFLKEFGIYKDDITKNLGSDNIQNMYDHGTPFHGQKRGQ